MAVNCEFCAFRKHSGVGSEWRSYYTRAYHTTSRSKCPYTVIGKISLKLVKYIQLSILSHSYMLCETVTNCNATVRSFGVCISQFVARPRTCLTWHVHIIKGNIFYMCTSSQCPLTIWCLHNTTMHFLARHLIFSLTKILESLTSKM